DPVRKLYQQRGKLPMFVEDFFKRIETEVPRNFGLLEKAAQSYERAGFHERALEIYDRIIRISPFQRSAVLAKANLLASLKRGEEAVALLRDPKGIASLDDELKGKYQLIRALFKLGRKGEAEKEIADLLAWAKGLPKLQTVADICLGQKEYRKAAGFFEQARALQRGGGDGPMVVGLGKCYARLHRGEEALKVWSELANSGDSDGQLDGVQDCLMAEGLYELAANLGEQRIARLPDNESLYLGLAEARQITGYTSAAF